MTNANLISFVQSILNDARSLDVSLGRQYHAKNSFQESTNLAAALTHCGFPAHFSFRRLESRDPNSSAPELVNCWLEINALLMDDMTLILHRAPEGFIPQKDWTDIEKLPYVIAFIAEQEAHGAICSWKGPFTTDYPQGKDPSVVNQLIEIITQKQACATRAAITASLSTQTSRHPPSNKM